jgi:hypothetical protein
MKVTEIKSVGKQKVYDVSVTDAEHYFLSNGVASHNTGGMYSANQVFIIGKAQEKDGTELVGYNFTINIEKSRFVREKSKFPFLVTFQGGINKYSGLLDVALEGGYVTKPSNGWYAKVNQETGEIGDKKRFNDTQNAEFMDSLLNDEGFNNYVKQKYAIAYGSILENTDVLEEVDETDV